MPATADSSDVLGFSMHLCSHITNFVSSGIVRTWRNDKFYRVSHNRNMARRGIPKGAVNWFLREWMDYLGVRQAQMIERTDWSKATASQLYTGKQDYSPKVVNEAAKALHVAPYELLMRPEDAMAIRRIRQEALRIVEGSKDVPPPASERKSA